MVYRLVGAKPSFKRCLLFDVCFSDFASRQIKNITLLGVAELVLLTDSYRVAVLNKQHNLTIRCPSFPSPVVGRCGSKASALFEVRRGVEMANVHALSPLLRYVGSRIVH